MRTPPSQRSTAYAQKSRTGYDCHEVWVVRKTSCGASLYMPKLTIRLSFIAVLHENLHTMKRHLLTLNLGKIYCNQTGFNYRCYARKLWLPKWCYHSNLDKFIIPMFLIIISAVTSSIFAVLLITFMVMLSLQMKHWVRMNGRRLYLGTEILVIGHSEWAG